MIYAASYFWTNHHHGLKVCISQTIPKGFKCDCKLDLFVPSNYLVNAFKKKKITEQGYIDRYREELRPKFNLIKAWLDKLTPEEDLTLLCWEPPGQFCHRNLALKFVEKYRPDCLGGEDVQQARVDLNCKKQVFEPINRIKQLDKAKF